MHAIALQAAHPGAVAAAVRGRRGGHGDRRSHRDIVLRPIGTDRTPRACWCIHPHRSRVAARAESQRKFTSTPAGEHGVPFGMKSGPQRVPIPRGFGASCLSNGGSTARRSRPNRTAFAVSVRVHDGWFPRRVPNENVARGWSIRTVPSANVALRRVCAMVPDPNVVWARRTRSVPNGNVERRCCEAPHSRCRSGALPASLDALPPRDREPQRRRRATRANLPRRTAASAVYARIQAATRLIADRHPHLEALMPSLRARARRRR